MSEIEPVLAYFLFMTRYRRALVSEQQREDYALSTLQNLLNYERAPQCIKARLYPIVATHLMQREARECSN